MERVRSPPSRLTVRTSGVGMLVKGDVISKDTMVSSISSFSSPTLDAKSSELQMRWPDCPTSGGMMMAKYLEMLYVTELTLLLMGLRGALSLCALGSP